MKLRPTMRAGRSRRPEAGLWVGEDGVAADTAPPDRGLVVDRHPLERCAPVGASEAPGQFPHPAGALHGFDPQPCRPDHAGIVDVAFGGGDELISDHLPELSELVVGESATVTGEPPGLLELHL